MSLSIFTIYIFSDLSKNEESKLPRLHFSEENKGHSLKIPVTENICMVAAKPGNKANTLINNFN